MLTVVEKVEAAVDPDALLQNLRGGLARRVLGVRVDHDDDLLVECLLEDSE